MNQLIYPPPGSPRRRSRPGLLVGLVAYAAFVALMAMALGWASAVYCLLVGVGFALLRLRQHTIITSDTIAVRGYVGGWKRPTSGVRQVVARDQTGAPVYAVLEDGRNRRLPQVRPGDLNDIAALTGVSVQDWTASR